MDILKVIKTDQLLSENLKQFCDFEILPKKEKCFIDSHIHYSNTGMTFGKPFKDNDASNYILLDDNTIAYYNVDWGSGGRIAENILEFFELMINIPDWLIYSDIEQYKSEKLLKKYIKKNEKNSENNSAQFKKIQKKICEKLSISIYDKVILLQRFYNTATRYPKLTVKYYDATPGWQNFDNKIVYRKSKGWVTEELCILRNKS